MSKGSKLQRWLIFGVGVPLVPLVFAITYHLVDGAYFKDLLYEFAPDFLLVVLSIAAGVANSATTGKWKKWSLFFSVVSILFCWGFYSWLCGLNHSPVHLHTILWISLAAFVLNIFLGIWTETSDASLSTHPSDA